MREIEVSGALTLPPVFFRHILHLRVLSAGRQVASTLRQPIVSLQGVGMKSHMVDNSAPLIFRPAFTSPGQQLVADEKGAVEAAKFALYAGLSDCYDAPVVSYPIPVYREQALGMRRFSFVPPGLMWHPLFWLPPQIFGQIDLPDRDKHEVGELHALRVALHLEDSGAYDSELGGFVDVLALHGIDIDDDFGISRVMRWQTGEPDEVLDTIDLTDMFGLDTDGLVAYQTLGDAIDILYGQ